MQSIASALLSQSQAPEDPESSNAAQRKANRVRWLKLNFTVKAARLQTLKRQKYQHLQEEALLKARGLLKNWENGVVVLTEDLYRLAAGEREAAELMNYTPEALALRFSLRNDPSVLEAVRQLWQVDMPRDSLGCIDQRGYASVFRRVAKSLDAKAFKKKQKVDKLLDEDWKRDSKGDPTMSFANFFDSIFELADLWCETIDADDYVGFLERLRDRISHVRYGKRVLKPLKKIGAFDADSDDEESEEEEPEDDESDEEKPVKPPATAPQPRILIAKAIKPVVQQQTAPANTTLRKVTRVAISSSKVLRPKEAATKQATGTTIAASVPTSESGAWPVTPSLDAVSPLGSTVRPGTPSHNSRRRSSVVTTIQFLQDGFVRSESVSNGTGGDVSSVQLPPSNVAISQAVAAAFAANAKREQGLRPSLASAAAAALARNEPAPSPDVHRPSSLSVSESAPVIAEAAAGPSERKRVITVSTAKYAVLKSVVFTTGKLGKHTGEGTAGVDDPPAQAERMPLNGEDQGLQNQPDDPSPSDLTHASDQLQLPPEPVAAKSCGAASGSTTTSSSPFANAVAIRIRTGSLFDLDNEQSNEKPATATKGVRLGFGKTAANAGKRGRGGLAPLTSLGGVSNSGGVGTRTLSIQKNALTAVVHGSQGSPAFSGSPSPNGIDFSESVLMTNFVVDRPLASANAQSVRAPIIIGAHAKKKAPLVAIASTNQNPSAGIHGTRALEAVLPSPEVFEAKDTNVDVPKKNKPMVLIMNKPLPPAHDEPTEAPHRFGGNALHSKGPFPTDQSPLLESASVPEGDPEHALRIKAALEHASREAQARTVVSRERHYEHTTTDAERVVDPPPSHGMTIQSMHRSVPHPVYMDPIATPWVTFDDDVHDAHTNFTSSTASFLQPENAMEALAKVMNQRAASLSAGTSRERTPTRRRSRTLEQAPSGDTDADDFRDEGDGGMTMRAPRTRLLTVSSLGGKSVEVLGPSKSTGRFTRRNSRDEYEDEWPLSASTPVLPTVSLLEIDVAQPQSTSRPSRTPSQQPRDSTPLIKLPVRGRRREMESVDDWELRGEVAMDPSLSPLPRSPLPTASKTSPAKICTCTRRRDPDSPNGDTIDSLSWPPPAFRLDPSAPDDKGDTCPACKASQATIIVNATREVHLEPQSKEHDVVAIASRKPPTRSEMMRRRHRYTRGKPT